MIVSELGMKLKKCVGGLTPREIEGLEEEPELRLHTCAVCGKRNLYALKDNLGRWTTESHDQPSPRMKEEVKNS
jgi:hypothetical protein